MGAAMWAQVLVLFQNNRAISHILARPHPRTCIPPLRYHLCMVAELVFHPRITCEDANLTHAAMAQNQMAVVGGDTPATPVRNIGNHGAFGITPVPSPVGGEPDGRSPNAKRPLDHATIQISTSGARPMSVED